MSKSNSLGTRVNSDPSGLPDPRDTPAAPTTPLICAACGGTDGPVVMVPLHPRCDWDGTEARASAPLDGSHAFPNCEVCGAAVDDPEAMDPCRLTTTDEGAE